MPFHLLHSAQGAKDRLFAQPRSVRETNSMAPRTSERRHRYSTPQSIPSDQAQTHISSLSPAQLDALQNWILGPEPFTTTQLSALKATIFGPPTEPTSQQRRGSASDQIPPHVTSTSPFFLPLQPQHNHSPSTGARHLFAQPILFAILFTILFLFLAFFLACGIHSLNTHNPRMNWTRHDRPPKTQTEASALERGDSTPQQPEKTPFARLHLLLQAMRTYFSLKRFPSLTTPGNASEMGALPRSAFPDPIPDIAPWRGSRFATGDGTGSLRFRAAGSESADGEREKEF